MSFKTFLNYLSILKTI